MRRSTRHLGPRRKALSVALALGVPLLGAWGCGARSALLTPEIDAGLGGTGGDAGALTCEDGTFTLSPAKPTVMLVLDHSQSMEGQLGSGQDSRWNVLTQALASTLPPADQAMAMGALVYPIGSLDQGGDGCLVPPTPNLMPALGQAGTVLGLMLSTLPAKGTPTAEAITVAATALQGVQSAKGARALVLATDGSPNCNDDLDPDTCQCSGGGGKGCGNGQCLDDVRTIERIAALFAEGLPTYVIGIQDAGEAELTAVLDAMAEAGGRPKPGGGQRYYAATSAAELEAALEAVVDQVGLCTYLLHSVPDDDGTLTIEVGGAAVPLDPSGVEGWMWGDKSNGEVILLGSACAAVKADHGLVVGAKVACQSG